MKEVDHLPRILARRFAVKAHGEQKYGKKPYVVHLDAVYAVLSSVGLADETLGPAGYLHDVLEDCPHVSEAELRETFGDRVGDIVVAVTGEGANRKERFESVARKVSVCPEAIPVKLSDRIANVEASKANNPKLFAMYRKEYSTFRNHLYVMSAYATGIDQLWARLDTTMGCSE